ncbi:MAG TPA: radical SAM family heme chaperone HemW [Thermoanaerobaculia bacterium]|nr:radical SAM family heme chaperone HemW [Thermoanaerobaculia bacterium]
MSLGIYIHLPFCRVRCSYCPFAISTDGSLEERYVAALVAEIGSRGSNTREIDTLYFGGGTPSRVSIEGLEAIFAMVRSNYRIAADCEITLEANPEDISELSIGAWRHLGVNRLSIGVQSFHDAELLPLGRVHGRSGALDALALARNSGIRFSLDLIAGLPNQTPDSFRASLAEALAAGGGHLSVYLLDLEPGTSLERRVAEGNVHLPDEEIVRELYLETVRAAAAHGLMQYEISNFARDGQQSRHNRRYWSRGEYFGFGVGAHSFLGGRRFANGRETERYISQLLNGESAQEFEETLGDGEVRRERILLGLRQTAGLRYSDLIELCGKEGQEWATRGISEGWLTSEGERVAFSTSGFLTSNDYISQLF